ncbi:MAG TPA: hypothetical protein VIY69_14445 [Candidatus Acidoferrales bacterium]
MSEYPEGAHWSQALRAIPLVFHLENPVRQLLMRNPLPVTALLIATLVIGESALSAMRADSPITTNSTGDPSAQQLLKKVIDNELAADKADDYLWLYVSESRKAGEDIKEKTLETRHGILTLELSVNGKPLAKDKETQQKEHIREMVSDPQEAIKAQQSQQHDADQAADMLRLLPKALLAKYGTRRGDLQALDFRPNPAFHPSSHEAEVFQAMSGTIWVNMKEDRLEEIDGHISHRVNFGWGVLGHLDQGGRFHVVQAEVVPGHWEIVKLLVDMRGKALFFKSISVQQDETRSDYKLLPSDITLAQGAKMIER